MKIDYTKYNDRKQSKKNNIILSEKEEAEMEEFRLNLVNNIEKNEIEEKTFSQWQFKYYYMRDKIY